MNHPAYVKVSKAFRIGRSAEANFSGVVIASPDAFYFVPGSNVGAMINVLRGLGGILRAIRGDKSAGRFLPTDSGVLETDLAELPEDIRGDPDWPAKLDKGPLLIVPRAAVTSVVYSFWKWGIFVSVKGVEFRIEPPLFGRKKLLRILREMGWEL